MLSVNDVIDRMNETTLKQSNVIWQPYSILRMDLEQRKRQISSLYYTGLKEPNDGIEYTFLPTKTMLAIEKKLENIYNQIKIEDHEIPLCDETFFTSKIEGAKTTIKRTQQIHDGARISSDNFYSESMILGSFNATKYLNIINGKIDQNTIRKVWEILTDNCCDNYDICGTQYRTGNVQVGTHVGLNPILLDEMMSRWITHYNSMKLNSYPFIKASFLHYTFEHIHPFCDGNGRLGRLLMYNWLIYNGYENMRAVSISRSIEKDLHDYYTAFTLADNVYADCTYFIEYMLAVMNDAVCDSLR